MAKRIEVILKREFRDAVAEGLKKRLAADFSISGISDILIADVYTFEDAISQQELEKIATELLSDPVSQIYSIGKPAFSGYSYAIEISFKAGVKDSVGETAREGACDAIGRALEGGVYTSRLYMFEGDFPQAEAKRVAEEVLCNPLIQEWKGISPFGAESYYASPRFPKAGESHKGSVFEIPLADLSDSELEKISKRRLLALNVPEMRAIAEHFSLSNTIAARKNEGLGEHPTDVELECIAQTWSEHCKHKIFNATITYSEGGKGKKEKIVSLFKTYIRATTQKVGKDAKYLVSVFTDNAGVIELIKGWNLVMKVETHNTPSALDPYGGALTGILGVNRDVLGTGLGAKPIFNTDVFCFADPFYSGKIPPRLLHPKRVFEGVRAGVERGGNASGIPTVNGSVFFDGRYLGKPLVYCGTGGIMPSSVAGKQSHIKTTQSGDRIFTVGGRVGKDGIHGATFSSEGLHEGSPTSAVQLGDPFTQKKVLDFILEARDGGLISGLTDMGAGGLSSAVGEMAQMTNGATLRLERAPLKYPGLDPWEILLSESQERMCVAVPPEKAGDFAALALKHSVEATDIGEFDSSGKFRVLYHNTPVLLLSLKFLHEGLPKMELEARWESPKLEEPDFIRENDYTKTLLSLLSRPNICSKESIVRQYDHEVMGMSVVKPMVGANGTGPSDAAVIQPFPDKNVGVVVSHGLAVHAGDIDPYNMAALAVDEAVRNYVAVGGNPSHWGALDNFCWPDPVKTQSNPDGDIKLGALVRANRALADACIAYSLPLISGKDSMKNDYKFGEWKISVPPTLLISLVGKIDDISYSTTSDFKNSGDRIYVLGTTSHELGGSEYYSMLGHTGKSVPEVDFEKNMKAYRKLHKAISQGLVASAHDISDGGIAVALAESCIGGAKGCSVDISKASLSPSNLREDVALFSESSGRFVVSVPQQHAKAFEEAMAGAPCAHVGMVTDDSTVSISNDAHIVVSCKTSELEASFKKTITW